MLKSLLGRYASSGLSSALANRSQHRRIPVSMCRSSAEGLQIKQAGSTGITNVLVAVDPDTRGAIACATWTADPGSSSPVELSSLSIKVFDMPCATVHLMKKMKATGKPAVRRTVDVQAARHLVMQSLSHPADSELKLQAYIESPPIIPSDSALSTASLSYTHGVWQGLLSMGGFTAGSVPARTWKKDFGLWKQDKDASRQLAIKLFPQMQDVLGLKKHHGRAEALLIAAWGLGVSIDTNTCEPTFGPMRGCIATDAYGNKVNTSSQAQVPDTDAILQGGFCIPMVCADAQTLHNMKLESARERLAKKAEKAEQRKKARKATKAALAECRQEEAEGEDNGILRMEDEGVNLSLSVV